ncbi:hypothetical protein BDZ91DRAFT_759699 [Kalaharituber pfeilii]|nr:hypothetical protein BDZ91DRAFT_759699 [Kalaharituber pfeilii]
MKFTLTSVYLLLAATTLANPIELESREKGVVGSSAAAGLVTAENNSEIVAQFTCPSPYSNFDLPLGIDGRHVLLLVTPEPSTRMLADNRHSLEPSAARVQLSRTEWDKPYKCNAYGLELG